jgi:hypothetical protein
MRVEAETEVDFDIGDFSDLENDKNIKMETYEMNKKILPPFMIFNNQARKYIVSPKK